MVSACSRGPSYPASTSSRAHSLEPFRLRPRRPSAHPQRRSLSGSGSLRSPSPCTAKARRIPTLPDRLQGHAPLASLVPRPWSLPDSQPAPAQNSSIKSTASPAPTNPPARPDSNQGQPGISRPNFSAYSSTLPRPNGSKGV